MELPTTAVAVVFRLMLLHTAATTTTTTAAAAAGGEHKPMSRHTFHHIFWPKQLFILQFSTADVAENHTQFSFPCKLHAVCACMHGIKI